MSVLDQPGAVCILGDVLVRFESPDRTHCEEKDKEPEEQEPRNPRAHRRDCLQLPAVEPTKANSLGAGSEAGQLGPQWSNIFRPLTIAERVHILKSTPSYNCNVAFANIQGAGKRLAPLPHTRRLY